ncbi:MAG: 50S ribosome-binding GTPase, partial [Burkholderiaceae bacterium]|nr:50S ribosome-binding GTPase [Burkholderiaceae bacterium]
MSVQWFPGHMHAARRKAAESMGGVDMVIEVLDARLPQASCNPMVKALRLSRQKPCLRLLNKSDLADPVVTREWIEWWGGNDDALAVAVSLKNPADVMKIPDWCREVVPTRGSADRPLRMMIMGIPNVGKSTLMNALLKRRVAAVRDDPAV